MKTVAGIVALHVRTPPIDHVSIRARADHVASKGRNRLVSVGARGGPAIATTGGHDEPTARTLPGNGIVFPCRGSSA